MARHEVVIHENTGATRTAAPYLGSYISKEQVALAQLADTVGAKCGLPAIQVMAILGGGRSLHDRPPSPAGGVFSNLPSSNPVRVPGGTGPMKSRGHPISEQGEIAANRIVREDFGEGVREPARG